MPTQKLRAVQPTPRRVRASTEATPAETRKSLIRRILCPIDFSEFSRRAVEQAVALANPYDAEITALFVFPIAPPATGEPSPLPSAAAVPPGVRSVVSGDLETFLRPARAAGLPLQVALVAGDPVNEILECAVAARADVIAMGTHGRSGCERWVLGSVTDKVLRRSPCPVLTVSRPVESSPALGARIERILCAVDLSESSQRTLEYGFSVARAAGAHLTLVHVVDGIDEARAAVPYGISQYGRQREAAAAERLREAAARGTRAGCRIEVRVATGKPYREILQIAGERKAGLIVMGTHGPSPIDRMFFGSTADHVVRGARCPVLTVRPSTPTR